MNVPFRRVLLDTGRLIDGGVSNLGVTSLHLYLLPKPINSAIVMFGLTIY